MVSYYGPRKHTAEISLNGKTIEMTIITFLQQSWRHGKFVHRNLILSTINTRTE